MRWTLADIAALIDGELIGDGTLVIERVLPLDEADADAITFLTDEKKCDRLATTRAAAVIVPQTVTDAPVAIIRVPSPEQALATLLSSFYAPHFPTNDGIHPTAVVHADVILGDEVSIGSYAVVDKQTRIDDCVRIGAGTVVGAKCHLGRNTWLYPRVTVYDDVTIGASAIIHSGAVIGSDGFGYVQDGRTIVKIPQVGGVIVGDDVEIGAGTTIDRATLGFTRIGRGTKIDNLVQIGHNVTIGEHVRICAQVGIAGSTTIEDGVVIAGQAGLQHHITVGSNVTIGGQAGVTKSVPADTVVSGYPARPHLEARRIEAYIGRLPKLVQQLQEQQRRIDNLEKELQQLMRSE